MRQWPARVVVGALAVATATPGVLHAARPMQTDDARVVDAGGCQLESWSRQNPDNNEFWALPSCNFTGNLEVTLGANRYSDAGRRSGDVIVQGKTLFRELAPGVTAYGLAVGAIVHTSPLDGQPRISSTYAYVPISRGFNDDRTFLHVNLGVQENRDAAVQSFTWGVGTEVLVTPRFALIGEAFGSSRGDESVQGGVRFWVVPNRWQIDATAGARIGQVGATRWWSLGVRILTPPFLR